jgi:hypothetical protein
MKTTITFDEKPPFQGEDNFADISLSIEKSDSVEKGIQAFLKGKLMVRNNKYEFEDGSKGDVCVKYSFKTLPEILHIQ